MSVKYHPFSKLTVMEYIQSI